MRSIRLTHSLRVQLILVRLYVPNTSAKFYSRFKIIIIAACSIVNVIPCFIVKSRPPNMPNAQWVVLFGRGPISLKYSHRINQIKLKAIVTFLYLYIWTYFSLTAYPVNIHLGYGGQRVLLPLLLKYDWRLCDVFDFTHQSCTTTWWCFLENPSSELYRVTNETQGILIACSLPVKAGSKAQCACDKAWSAALSISVGIWQKCCT